MITNIVTIKPRTPQDSVGCIEYQVLEDDGVTVVSHGHQIPLPAEAGGQTTLAEAEGLVLNDAYRTGIVEAPEGWVDPAPSEEAQPEEETPPE